MNRILKSVIVILSVFFCSCKTEPAPEPEPDEVDLDLASLNLGFEVESSWNSSRPAGWYAAGTRYVISLDSQEKHSGMCSLKMETQDNPNDAFGVCSNNLPIEVFAGKILEFSGWIKTKGVQNGYAGLWMRVDGENGITLGLDNMSNRGLIGDNDWTQVSIRMNIDKNAKKIVFGGLFSGTGTAWFDDFEIVLNPEPVDPSSLNLDFEFKNPVNPLVPANWYTGGAGFSISLDNNEKHSGNLSLKMETPDNPNKTYGVFNTTLYTETYAGKVVEYSGWIKTKGVQNGYAGLWFGVYGEDGIRLGFSDMYYRGLIGDNDWTQVFIRMYVSKEARTISFGGEFNGTGTVWFDDLKIVIKSDTKTSLSQEELATLKRYVYPLRTYEPDGGDTKDLMVLDGLIGNSKVVGLGENSHGSSEIFKMKDRIIQYLAVNHDFNIFSIEAAMPEAYKLNDYTVYGKDDPKNLIAGMYFWTWRTEEMLNMVEWMRRFNQPNPRIYYTGFDMQFYSGAINELVNAFKGDVEVEPIIADLKKKLADRAGINEIDPILLLLQNHIETSSFPSSQQAWLLQNIVIIRQYLVRYSGAWRDKCMAENVIWIKEQNPDSKLVLWAHNIHIMKTENMMGSHLAQKFGDDYTTFGFTFYEGSYIASGSKGITSYEATTAYPGTLEYLLNQLNEPIFILDLKKIKSDNFKDTQWLMEYLPYREADELGDRKITEFIYRKITDDFDYLIFIKRSSPAAIFYVNND